MWLFSGESEGGEGIHNVSPLLRGASGGGALEGFDFLLDSVGASASSASDLGGSTSASARASAGASVSTGANGSVTMATEAREARTHGKENTGTTPSADGLVSLSWGSMDGTLLGLGGGIDA